MPTVSVDMEIAAPADRVWHVVTRVERYPDSMSSVQWVRILAEDGCRRRSAWSIVLKGAVLRWEEAEHLRHDARVMEFRQLSGDMELFQGAWRLTPLGECRTGVVLSIDFEIGIPLLAEMLNPVAERSLRENCAEMLRGIETSLSQ
jgi:ribosome-associated toxin RatA of RatAB toxin-antitoxin module